MTDREVTAHLPLRWPTRSGRMSASETPSERAERPGWAPNGPSQPKPPMVVMSGIGHVSRVPEWLGWAQSRRSYAPSTLGTLHCAAT